uniref:Uncharacterized protein n=1 Tax=Cucumis melo TaxID=3656 RepID=A0A9I9D492_CUCME
GKREEEEEKATDEGIGPDDENNGALVGPEEEDQSKERETPPPEPEPERKTQTETSVLPDCLLLMMYEPKLTMEGKENGRQRPTTASPTEEMRNEANGHYADGSYCSADKMVVFVSSGSGCGGDDRTEASKGEGLRAKDRKLEPHRPATFGVGAAEVGF